MTMIVGSAGPVYPRPEPLPAGPEADAPAPAPAIVHPTGAFKVRAMPAILTMPDTTAQLIAQQAPAPAADSASKTAVGAAPKDAPDISVLSPDTPASPATTAAATAAPASVPLPVGGSTEPTTAPEPSYRRTATLAGTIAATRPRTYGFRDAAALLATRPQATAAKPAQTGLAQAIAASLAR